MEYSVKLTEKEVKALGERRWQKTVVWRLTGVFVVTVLWCFFIWALMLLKTDSGTLSRWLLLVASIIPIVTLAVWVTKRLTKKGRAFLEKVKYENMSEA